MHLLTRLCTVAAADLTPRQLDECVLDIGLPAQLAALLTSAVSSQAIRVPAALALRGLMRAPHIVTSCKKDGQLAVLLQALQAAPRQGPLGCQVSEILLKLGHLGAPSELGECLAAAFIDRDDDDREKEAADAVMHWPDGTHLGLHRALLAARAPTWLALLMEATIDASASSEAAPAPAVAEVIPASFDGYGYADGVETASPPQYEWHLTPHEAAVLPYASTAILYELVVSGSARVPESLRPKALLTAVERLKLKPLLVAPPTNPSGVPWLSLHVSAIAGGLPSLADICFELRDGVLPGHTPLLSAGSEYFHTLLHFHQSTRPDQRIRIDDAGVASFRHLLRYVYARTLPAADAAAAALGAARKGKTRSQPANPAATASLPNDVAAPEWTPPPLVHELDPAFVGDTSMMWQRLQEEADASEGWLRERLAAVRGDGGGKEEEDDDEASPLSAMDALELACLAKRYMLDPLAHAAHAVLESALAADLHRSVEDFVGLVVRAHVDCDEGACEVLFKWAISNYDLVQQKLDLWLTCSSSAALPPVERSIGEEGLRDLSESLRAAMVRERHGERERERERDRDERESLRLAVSASLSLKHGR